MVPKNLFFSIKSNLRIRLIEGMLSFFNPSNEVEVTLCKDATGVVLKILCSQSIESKEEKDILVYLLSRGFLDLSEERREFEIKNVGKPNLESLMIQVNTNCNLRCKMCYLPKKDSDGPNKEKIISMIDEAVEMGAIRVIFTGGEPFLRKDIFEILKYAKSKNLWIGVISNGTLIRRDSAERISQIGINQVAISIDSHIEEINDFQRGKHSMMMIMKGIKNLKEYSVPIRLNHVLSRMNIAKFKDYLKYFEDEFGITNVQFAPVISRGEGSGYKMGISDEEFGQAMLSKELQEIRVLFREAPAKKRFLEEVEEKIIYKEKKNYTGCGIGFNLMYITSNGNISMCPTMTRHDSKEFDFGNLNEINLKSGWANIHEKFFKVTCEKNTSCEFWEKCRGGCRSDAFIRTGNVRACDEASRAGFELMKKNKVN